MKNSWYKKGVVFGIIVLFIGIAIAPSNAVGLPENTNVEPKQYLFQTIIDISNNPDVKELLENNNDFFTSHFDASLFRKILYRNPLLMFSILYKKPKMTHEYLNFAHNKGNKIVNIIGEDEVLELVESVEITNPELFDSLANIINNDEELSNRISVLAEMNEELKIGKPLVDNPIICVMLFLCFVSLYMPAMYFRSLHFQYEHIPIISIFFLSLMYAFGYSGLFFLALLVEFDCLPAYI